MAIEEAERRRESQSKRGEEREKCMGVKMKIEWFPTNEFIEIIKIEIIV